MYCGIDIGTSAIKCAIIDEGGTVIGFGRASVGLYRGTHPDSWESDPAEWLKATANAFGQAAAAPGYKPAYLRGLAISGNGPTLVAVGSDGLSVSLASSWMDRSAVAEAERVSTVAGRRIDPSFYLPKALKFMESPLATSIKRFFSGPEYLAFMLGAMPVSFLPDPYYDRHIWALEMATTLGLDEALFPPYIAPARIIGQVSSQAAEATGLPSGLPLVSAFPDFLAALVGSGTVRPGMACDRSGSSEALNLCAKKPFPDQTIFSLPHAVPGLWNLSGGLSTSGKALEWFSRAGGYTGHGMDNLNGEAGQVAPGADGVLFLPYLTGERAPLWNKDIRGAFLGLSLNNGRKEMARAVLESIAFALRLSAERMAEGGFALDMVRCSGGAARDSTLNAIKAAVLKVPVEIPLLSDSEPVGDACAVAVALGDHPNLEQASRAMVSVGKIFKPDPELTGLYDHGYSAWKQALDAVLGLNG
jgi:xylulokinase